MGCCMSWTDVVMQRDNENARTLLMVVWKSLRIPHSCCVLMVTPVSLSVLTPGSWMTTCWCYLYQSCAWIAGIVACRIVLICCGMAILLALLIVDCIQPCDHLRLTVSSVSDGFHLNILHAYRATSLPKTGLNDCRGELINIYLADRDSSFRYSMWYKCLKINT
jgi:hypothetical protein